MSNGPVKAKDISDELYGEIIKLLLRETLGKQAVADILNAAIEAESASPPVYQIRRRNNLKMIGLALNKEDAIRHEAFWPSTFAKHWKGER